MINSMNDIKSQMNECARIMNDMMMNEDAIDFIDDIIIIMNACKSMIELNCECIDEDDMIDSIDIDELNESFESLNRYCNLMRFIA